MATQQGEELLADPYAASSTSAGKGLSSSVPSLPPGGGWAATEQLQLPKGVASSEQPDFLFPENYDTDFRRSWGERLTFHAGSAYLVGMLTGSVHGVGVGMRESVGERQRIRVNAVLNSWAKRGPGLGNSLGCLAMMTSIFESIAYNARGTDDILNPVGAAAFTGAIFKSQAGPRIAGATALGLGAMAAVGTFVSKELTSRGML